MPTPDVTAGTIMDSSAALLNDVAKDLYTYVEQLPLLKIALKELRELFELNNIPVTETVTSVINVPTNQSKGTDGNLIIGFNTTPGILPANLVDIQKLWERSEGIDPFVSMTKKNSLPHYMEGVLISSFQIWAWYSNAINLLPANRNNDLKIDYIKELFGSIVDQNSIIGVINAESFLHFRTAALCAEFIGENKTRAESLNDDAVLALERATGIESKSMQAIVTRHKPFRLGYKTRHARP